MPNIVCEMNWSIVLKNTSNSKTHILLPIMIMNAELGVIVLKMQQLVNIHISTL
jgi:hypothetical protein